MNRIIKAYAFEVNGIYCQTTSTLFSSEDLIPYLCGGAVDSKPKKNRRMAFEYMAAAETTLSRPCANSVLGDVVQKKRQSRGAVFVQPQDRGVFLR